VAKAVKEESDFASIATAMGEFQGFCRDRQSDNQSFCMTEAIQQRRSESIDTIEQALNGVVEILELPVRGGSHRRARYVDQAGWGGCVGA